MSPSYVLGLSYSHDASVALLRDGVPRVAIQKERLTRKKHDGDIRSIDLSECIEYCLAAEGISLSDVSLAVENSPTILYCKDRDFVLGLPRERMLDQLDPTKIVSISHHLAHAYCAYGISPFDSCAVMIIDGQGNYREDLTEDLSAATVFPEVSESSYIERESFYRFANGKCQVIRKNLSTIHKSFVRICGLGHLYEQVASYVFRSRFDAGKLMGLAAYGHPIDGLRMLQMLPSGEICYENEWIRNCRLPHPTPERFNRDFQQYANLAATTQSVLENSVVSLAQWLQRTTEELDLAYSGGVALNCEANRRLYSESGFTSHFVTPPSSDCGISLGCAFYGYLEVLGRTKENSEYLDYLGREYSYAETQAALDSAEGIKYRKSQDSAAEAAEAIARGEVIGWFQGGSEFGPRALGNRSILADPREESMRDYVNGKIKKREWFRPLAPVVLERSAEALFDITYSPYMLQTASVNPAWVDRLMAVSHVDGTARVQTVNTRQNPKLHRLIEAFEAITGVPVVLNTSFNGDNEPIVETPQDAVQTYLHTSLDRLFVGDFVVERR